MRLLLVRHSASPADDRVSTWCTMNGVVPDYRYPFQGDLLGDITEDLGGVVFFGGMFNAYDTEVHPFLNEEYRMMGAAIEAGVPILGICQGAQMIAYHSGAWAGAPAHSNTEFGYYEVTPTEAGKDWLPAPVHFTQWHFHTFDLPEGAELLASSALFPNQAFAIGSKILGLQFHAEVTIEGFRRWQRKAPPEEWSKAGVQPEVEQTSAMYQHDAAQADWFYKTLDRLFGTPTR